MMALRILAWIVTIGVVVALGFAAFVRLAPGRVEIWHVDPLEAAGTGKPNAWRVGPADYGAQPLDAVAPSYDMTATELAETFTAMALAQPRTRMVAGSLEELCVTFVQRSRFWGFPDYVSVRFVELNRGRSTLAIYSRSRFGESDLGVNRARVEAWLAAL